MSAHCTTCDATEGWYDQVSSLRTELEEARAENLSLRHVVVVAADELKESRYALTEIALLLSAPPKLATTEQRLEAAVKTARMALSPNPEGEK